MTSAVIDWHWKFILTTLVQISLADVPAEYFDQAQEYRENWWKQSCWNWWRLDDEIPEGEEITNEELKAAIRKATINVEFSQYCGSAFQEQGCSIDAWCGYRLPSKPTLTSQRSAVNPDTDEEEIRSYLDEEPFAALASKIMTDPFVGRWHSSVHNCKVLQSGSHVLNTSKGVERIGRIPANSQSRNWHQAYSGDIADAGLERYYNWWLIDRWKS